MSRVGKLLSDRRNGFPRVSGDEPMCNEYAYQLAKFSPRERG